MSSTVAVTLVFTDLVGSTAIGTSLHPEETERLRHIDDDPSNSKTLLVGQLTP